MPAAARSEERKTEHERGFLSHHARRCAKLPRYSLRPHAPSRRPRARRRRGARNTGNRRGTPEGLLRSVARRSPEARRTPRSRRSRPGSRRYSSRARDRPSVNRRVAAEANRRPRSRRHPRHRCPRLLAARGIGNAPVFRLRKCRRPSPVARCQRVRRPASLRFE